MVTMTSEADKTETTLTMANKSMPSPILKSTTQQQHTENVIIATTKAKETAETTETTETTLITAATVITPTINNNNCINDINYKDKETIYDKIAASTTTTTFNTNGMASNITNMKLEDVEKVMTSTTNGKQGHMNKCYDDKLSNKEDATIVNNTVTIEIRCNTPVIETVITATTTTTTSTTVTTNNTTITQNITLENSNAISGRNSNTTTISNTVGTANTTNSINLNENNIRQTNINSTDNGNISSLPSTSCHQKATSHQSNIITAHSTTTTTSTFQQHSKNENAPNILVYKKMEAIIEKMQAEGTGVTVRTVKGFITKVPSVFTGADLIAWILKNLDIDDVTEALHFAHLLSSHGYIFPIDDHALTVKNDGTFYRFQTPYFWPSNCWEPENTDYAVYLCKRTMQNKTRLELADYEAENLAKLQKMFSRKWEFIFMQAESQSKVAKKRDKLERKVLDSQERAFWDVHRPMPGCVNTTEIDIKKAYRRGDCSHGTGSAGASVTKNPIELLTRIIALRKQKLERRTIKISKAAEALVSYYEQYYEFDYFITASEMPNPWQTDSTEMWDAEKNSKEVPLRNVKRWAFNMRELLKDPVGREQFAKFLEKEYSVENILFWEAVQEMKTLPQSSITKSIQKIWQEFLAPDAPYAVNIDSKSIDLARDAVNSTNPNRWCFDVAAAHIYHLMERDSYPRYLRSDMYKDFLNCSKKKVKSIPNLFGVKR